MTNRTRGLLLALAAAAVFVAPATANAVTRYAAPGGTALDTVCTTPAAPKCSIGMAAGGPNVQPADEAVITPGNYSDTAGDLDGDAGNPTDDVVQPIAASVHGDLAQPRPVITLNSTTNSFWGAFLLGVTTTLSHLEIDTGPDSTASSNLTLQSATSVVDRVIARSSVDDAIVCNHVLGTYRDTACLSSGSGAKAVGSSNANPFTATIYLRGVTAIASGSGSAGIHYFFGAFGPPPPNITISAKSVIAQGGGTNDVIAQASGGATTTINLDHSNYDTSTTITSTGGVASVTTPGTGSPNFNVIASPLLAADGYHQLAGSPTINAGAALDPPNSGTTDIDGQARQIGLAAPDIGADEIGVSSSTTVACAPASLVSGSPTTCTATVSASAEALSGSVSFGSGAAGSFSNAGSCTLTGGLTTKQCSVTYTPTSAGAHGITASYGGDGSHEASMGTTSLTVSSPSGTAADCAKLRKKLKKARKAGNKPLVKKLRKKLRKLGC